MAHTIVVNSDQDGAFAWKLPEDISQAIDSIGEKSPMLAQTILLVARNTVSQFVSVMNIALRNEMAEDDCFIIIGETLASLRAEMADLVNPPNSHN